MTDTIYSKLGDEKLKQLLDHFYDSIFQSEIAHLFNKTEKEVIKDKQFCFLTQFFGGPLRYVEKYGQPQMKIKHLPHQIGQNEKEIWLACMKESIETLDVSDEFKSTLYNCFPRVAQNMVNY